MNREDAIVKIKETFKSLMSFASEISDKKFAEFECKDGLKMSSESDKLEVGSEVFKIDEKGEKMPIEDGEYELMDGKKIVVKSNFVESISEVEEKPQEEVETPQEEMKSEVKLEDGMPEAPEVEVEEEEKEEEPSDKFESRLSEIEKQIGDILSILEKIGSKQGEVNEVLMSKINSLSEENGGQPIKMSKKQFSDYKPGKSGFVEELKDYIKNKNK